MTDLLLHLFVLTLVATGGDVAGFSEYMFKSRESLARQSRIQSRYSLLLNEKKTSRYDETGAGLKGLVSSLTSLVNSFSKGASSFSEQSKLPRPVGEPPKSPEELLERIREDYTVNNYLWTGNIDLSSFDDQCRFTDPTLAFTGTDQFVNNIQNLRPIVDNLVNSGACSSNLLDIKLIKAESYIKSRWNMIGELSALPWKPRIDVIGTTKFWYERSENGFRVTFYDEEWEISAAKALLQLVTPPGTVPNTSES